MIKEFDVIGFGSILVDELVVLPYFPKADTKIEIIKTQKQVGGPVPTALKALTKLGVKTSFIGKVGSDANGEFIKHFLAESGVNTSNLITEKNSQSGYAQVWIDSMSKTRTIAYSSGSLNEMTLNSIPLESMPKSKLLHLDGRNHQDAETLIPFMQNRNTLVSIDTGNFRERTLDLLEYIDIAMMPKQFAVDFIGEDQIENLAKKIRKLYPQLKLIVITDGINGSVCSYKDKVYTQKIFDVEVTDTTGAGDIHSAGVLYGAMKGWKIEKILEFAAALAALKCKYLGNTILPDLYETEDFMRNSRLTAAKNR